MYNLSNHLWLQVGLAVGDIKAIQDEAELRSNRLQVGVYAFPAWGTSAYACIHIIMSVYVSYVSLGCVNATYVYLEFIKLVNGSVELIVYRFPTLCDSLCKAKNNYTMS